MSERFPGIEGSDRPVADDSYFTRQSLASSVATCSFDAVLIKPLDQQADRDPPRIDPASASFDPEREIPVFWEFDYSKYLGTARLTREPDGSIMAHGEVTGIEWWGVDVQPRLAAQVRTTVPFVKDELVIRESEIIAAALCREHSDPEQPPIVTHVIQTRSDQ